MKVPGYCERCRRFRQVTVRAFTQPPSSVQVGICAECESKERR